MAITIEPDFTTDISGDFLGAGVTYDGGADTIRVNEQGIAVYDTQVATSGNIWVTYVIESLPGADATNVGIVFGANVDPDGALLILSTGANDSLNLDQMTEYLNGTTYNSAPDEDLGDQEITQGVDAVGFTLAVTVNFTTNVISFWVDPTEAEPTDVDNWDSGTDSADTTIDLDVDAANHTLYGRYVGIGNWASAGPTISGLVAGDFGAAGGSTRSSNLTLLGVG